ncbi:Zn-ribbon domain-containing OB-fold protein [Paraburkholderia sp. BL10I2N1]|uniref:Zn-ribbon domain-containing OB-fold protein n=1 Tax=Paraburkholderia sp. BL10I2N1 TaxID=1938796 RepID=UPI0010D061CB|nr:Zn-ribbon domain-containing OB-fold protein [Paraburkholderia sp. BL10I2N1]TDN58020.1 hypothetical protein B0G77_8881 [Paraburkholderia sp. BL10I2N1]TDN59130.1 hypothetical protein B0G77_8321 [Paraburkholderia sp. BL10I2N1]
MKQASDTTRALPVPTRETAPYWRMANEGRLVVQRCGSCGRRQFYPRAFCTACLSDSVEWVDCSGRGTIYTYTICHIAGHPSMADKVPYAVAMIDLDEGVRMLAGIVDSDLAQVAIGAPVEVTFERISAEYALPQFKIATGTSS